MSGDFSNLELQILRPPLAAAIALCAKYLIGRTRRSNPHTPQADSNAVLEDLRGSGCTHLSRANTLADARVCSPLMGCCRNGQPIQQS